MLFTFRLFSQCVVSIQDIHNVLDFVDIIVQTRLELLVQKRQIVVHLQNAFFILALTGLADALAQFYDFLVLLKYVNVLFDLALLLDGLHGSVQDE